MATPQMGPVESKVSSVEEIIEPRERFKLFWPVLVRTIFSFGLNLLSASQRNLWRQVFTGKRIVQSTSGPGQSVNSVARKIILSEEDVPQRVHPVQESSSSPAEVQRVAINVSQDSQLISLFKIRPVESKVSSDLCDEICRDLDCKAKPGRAVQFVQQRMKRSGNESCLSGTSLTECHCSSSTMRGENSMSYAFSPRVQLEKQLIQKVEKLIKEGKIDTSKPLVLCSLGSGGLLEELIIHANLSKLGLQVRWVLVEPFYFNEQGKVKRDFKPLGDFCSYAQAISQKRGAPPPEVCVVNGCTHLVEQSDLMKGLRESTTNPFVWFMIDPDEIQTIEGTRAFMQRLPPTDLQASLLKDSLLKKEEKPLKTNF